MLMVAGQPGGVGLDAQRLAGLATITGGGLAPIRPQSLEETGVLEDTTSILSVTTLTQQHVQVNDRKVQQYVHY